MMTFGVARGGRGIWPFFFPLMVAVGVSIYWYYGRVKRVAVDADGLVVSNFLREIRVPWRDIVEVTGSRWVSTRQVTITLDRDLGFGTSIIFMYTIAGGLHAAIWTDFFQIHVAILGFLSAAIRRVPRPVSPELMRFHRSEQMQKLKAIVGTLARLKKVDAFSVMTRGETATKGSTRT